MSTKWSLFNSCAPTDVSPNIKARCVRCYGVPSQNNKQELSSFECAFHDEETFEEILAMKDIATAVPFDVIGRVTHSSNVLERTMRNGSQKRLINLELEDLEGKRLGCTIWEEYADECWKQLEEKKQSANIIILQLCRATIHQGRCKMDTLTKILVNVDLPQMNEFKQRIVIDSSLSTTISSSTSHATNS
ncbi:hypothetical protein C2S52_020360 [Perilla frutescens var. hirtella]|nr:hypothetical protein C2S52_020360 [Perilla frutescens var. hirtella]